MKRRIRRSLLIAGLAGLCLGLAACGSGKSSAKSQQPDATAVPAATAAASPTAQSSSQSKAPTTPGALTPDGNRVYENVKYLSRAPRPSGTAEEKAAADYVADKLRTAGYDVSLQEFSVETQAREALLTTKAGTKVTTIPLQGSGSGKVSAQLVAAGLGNPADFPSTAKGAVVLLQRGTLTFNDKVLNAQAAGAIGVVIANNERDVFNGNLSTQAKVPVIAISQAEGAALLASIANGRVDVDMSVGANGVTKSNNVIAKPPGKDCDTITGGHYDTVPIAPGASDNGTGTATVIEIASVMASKGEMHNNCFILFGSEELGLVGSQFYVNSLDKAARTRIKAMFNYDMVGVGNDGWLFIGDSNLQHLAQTSGATVGVTGALGQLSGASSDYAAFQKGGIPAFMLYRTQDNLLHTPQDVIDRVRPELLEQAAKLGVAMLESVNTGG